MKLLNAILIMFAASFVIGYATMPIILGLISPYHQNHANKFYGAMLMASTMGLVELFMHGFNVFWMSVLIAIMFLSYYFIRTQMGVNEKQFLKGMIEHHGMALAMVSGLEKREDVSPETQALGKQIYTAQTKEISWMENRLNALN
jgi:uncharacterized protein (DUF305 family)